MQYAGFFLFDPIGINKGGSRLKINDPSASRLPVNGNGGGNPPHPPEQGPYTTDSLTSYTNESLTEYTNA